MGRRVFLGDGVCEFRWQCWMRAAWMDISVTKMYMKLVIPSFVERERENAGE